MALKFGGSDGWQVRVPTRVPTRVPGCCGAFTPGPPQSRVPTRVPPRPTRVPNGVFIKVLGSAHFVSQFVSRPGPGRVRTLHSTFGGLRLTVSCPDPREGAQLVSRPPDEREGPELVWER